MNAALEALEQDYHEATAGLAIAVRDFLAGSATRIALECELGRFERARDAGLDYIERFPG